MYAFVPWYVRLLQIPHLNVLLYNMLLGSTKGFHLLNRLLTTRIAGDGDGMRYVAEGFHRTPAGTAIDYIRAASRFEKRYRRLYRERFRTDVPVIYVEDGRTFTPIRLFRETAPTYFRNLTVLSIPESRHIPIAEQPGLFSARVLSHLGHPVAEGGRCVPSGGGESSKTRHKAGGGGDWRDCPSPDA